MTRYSRGSRRAACRWNRPGSSLRLARSPVAPNSTMTWLSGFGELNFFLALASGAPPTSPSLFTGAAFPRRSSLASQCLLVLARRRRAPLARSSGRSGLLLRVAAELRTHRGQDLPGERAVVPGLEPLVQRGGDDRGGHPGVH